VTLLDRARRFLEHRSIVLRATLIATFLSLPALRLGLYLDDHLQRLAALNEVRLGFTSKGVLWLFSFFDGDPARTQRMIDAGMLAWWTDLRVRIMFFRPLSSLTHVLDHRVLDHPVLMHAQSILWYALVVASVAALLRRTIGGLVAGLAAVLFAVDHTHGVLVGWIANRNALVAAAFAVPTLLFHDRFRRDGRSRDATLAAVSLGLGLCGGETALAIVAYLVAHAWFLERRSRVRALAPYAPVLILWAILYRLGHFGARHSGMYQDPLQSPLTFIAKVLENGPLLLAAELGVPGVDVYPFLPTQARALLWGVSTIVIALGFLASRSVLKSDPVMRFFALGSVLSVVPFCAGMPSSRLLLLPSIGVLAVVARIVVDVLDRALSGFPAKFTAVLAGGGHVFLSPFVFVFLLHQMQIVEDFLVRNANGLPRDPELAQQRLIVVNAPDATFVGYVSVILEERGVPAPQSILSLAVGTRPVELERLDERTVIARSSVALMQPGGTDLLTRSASEPPPIGFRARAGDVEIEVTSVNAAGWPNEAKFTFPTPIEDRRYRWVAWRDQTLKPFELPRVGQRTELPAAIPQLF